MDKEVLESLILLIREDLFLGKVSVWSLRNVTFPRYADTKPGKETEERGQMLLTNAHIKLPDIFSVEMDYTWFIDRRLKIIIIEKFYQPQENKIWKRRYFLF